MIYWHVEKNSVCIYSQLKACSSSEVAAMIEGGAASRHRNGRRKSNMWIPTDRVKWASRSATCLVLHFCRA
jgi:hypothetical protein